jgi:CRP-like cAMP-binding protein
MPGNHRSRLTSRGILYYSHCMSTEVFRNLPLLDQLEEKDLSTMLKNNIISTVSFDADEVIITEKRFVRKIYFMLKGKVKITRDVVTGNSRQCKEIKTIDGSGHFLGEITAFTGKPRTATVTTIRPTACIMINLGLLMKTSTKMLERVKTKFYPLLFELLSKRLDETNENLVANKQKCEELEKKLKTVTMEKMALKQEYQETIRNKNKELKLMEVRLEGK